MTIIILIQISTSEHNQRQEKTNYKAFLHNVKFHDCHNEQPNNNLLVYNCGFQSQGEYVPLSL